MKRLLLLLFASLIVNLSFSQKNEDVSKTKFGFGLGTNYSFVHPMLQSFPDYKEVSSGVGFVTSVFMDYELSNRLILSPKAEIAINSLEILDSKATTVYNVYPASLEFVYHLNYNIVTGKNSVYMIAGPGGRFTLSEKNTNEKYRNKPDLFFDLGIGFDHWFGLFHFSPELRYSLGMFNVNRDATVPAFKYNKLSLICYFN